MATEKCFQLLDFKGPSSGTPMVDSAAYQRVAKARRRIAVVGIGRSGKSSLLNMISSTLAGRHCAPFRAARGAEHVTYGVQAAIVGDVALIDCQGVALGDGSRDKPLLLAAHYLADVVVYNQRGVLDSTIFANLTQMAAFVALAEGGRSAPPLLVIRLRDSDDDFAGDAGAARAATLVARFLDPAVADQHRTMRSAFAKLFSGVRVVATDELSRKDVDPMGADYAAFLRIQPSFAAAARAVLAHADDAPRAALGEHADFCALLADQCGLSLKDLDVLSAGVELAMRRFVDGFRVLPPPATDFAALEERRVVAVKALDDFDKQFCRVADSSLAGQRAALRELLCAPLAAARRAFADRLFREAGAVDTPPAWWRGPPGDGGLAAYSMRTVSHNNVAQDEIPCNCQPPPGFSGVNAIYALRRSLPKTIWGSVNEACGRVPAPFASWADDHKQRRQTYQKERIELAKRARVGWLEAATAKCEGPLADLGTDKTTGIKTPFPDPSYPEAFREIEARFAAQVRAAFDVYAAGSTAYQLRARVGVTDELVSDFLTFPATEFVSLSPSDHQEQFHADYTKLSASSPAPAVIAARRARLGGYLLWCDRAALAALPDALGKDLYVGEPNAPVLVDLDLSAGNYGGLQYSHGLEISTSRYVDRYCSHNSMRAIRNGPAHKAYAEALAMCFDVPRDVAMGLRGPSEIPRELVRVNHVPRHLRFLDALDAIPIVHVGNVDE